MKVVYIIAKGDWYKEVSKEEWDKFEGEKHIVPGHWKLMMVTEWLLKYRYA